MSSSKSQNRSRAQASAMCQMFNSSTVSGRAPVFYPSESEFSSFADFITRIEPIARPYGICKIVPPASFSPASFDRESRFTAIKAPLKQTVVRAERGDGHYRLRVTWGADVPVEQFRASANAVQPAPPTPVAANATEEMLFAHDERVERLFWKQLAQGHGAVYGADMLGSLFDPELEWNFARLDNLLQALPRVAGINEPYLYWGTWRAMFAWHIEDKDLFSINYLHFGEPKSWYGINPELADFFEGYCQSFFDAENISCAEFLRHKSCMVDPSELAKHKIVVQRTTQRVGEFVVTFPRAYHAGFNHGFNCAEAVNFAFESWLDAGDAAGVCVCNRDAVKVDVAFLRSVSAKLPPHVPRAFGAPAARRRYPMTEQPLALDASVVARPKMAPVTTPSSGAPKKKTRNVVKTTPEVTSVDDHDNADVDFDDDVKDDSKSTAKIVTDANDDDDDDDNDDDNDCVIIEMSVEKPRKRARVAAKRAIVMHDSPPRSRLTKSMGVRSAVSVRNEELLRELVLPVSFRVDDCEVTVVCLGQLTPLESFQRRTTIIPVGYVATCTFQCAISSRRQCAYVCEVLVVGNKPRFRVQPPCAPRRSVVSSSPDAAWSKMHKSVKYVHKSIDGEKRFGLSLPQVRRMLQLLPGADTMLSLYKKIDDHQHEEKEEDEEDNGDDKKVAGNRRRGESRRAAAIAAAAAHESLSNDDDVFDIAGGADIGV